VLRCVIKTSNVALSGLVEDLLQSVHLRRREGGSGRWLRRVGGAIDVAAVSEGSQGRGLVEVGKDPGTVGGQDLSTWVYTASTHAVTERQEVVES